jgi:hypothetical protein
MIETPIEVTVDGFRFRLMIEKVKFVSPENYTSFGVELQQTQILCHKNLFGQIVDSIHLTF